MRAVGLGLEDLRLLLEHAGVRESYVVPKAGAPPADVTACVSGYTEDGVGASGEERGVGGGSINQQENDDEDADNHRRGIRTSSRQVMGRDKWRGL